MKVDQQKHYRWRTESEGTERIVDTLFNGDVQGQRGRLSCSPVPIQGLWTKVSLEQRADPTTLRLVSNVLNAHFSPRVCADVNASLHYQRLEMNHLHPPRDAQLMAFTPILCAWSVARGGFREPASQAFPHVLRASEFGGDPRRCLALARRRNGQTGDQVLEQKMMMKMFLTLSSHL